MAVGIALFGVVGSTTAYTTLRKIGKRANALQGVEYFAIGCEPIYNADVQNEAYHRTRHAYEHSYATCFAESAICPSSQADLLGLSRRHCMSQRISAAINDIDARRASLTRVLSDL